MTSKGDLLNKAIVIATNAHAHQKDKSGAPYILHPLTVMQILDTKDEELMCVAVLHDVIEDTDVTYAQLIEAGMTERVLAGVRALTKQLGQSYEEYKEAVFANEDAMLVKMADLTHNTDIRRLKGVTQKDIDRMARYHTFYYELKMRMGNG